MQRFFFITGSFSAFFAVAMGAFAAHGLKSKLPQEMSDIFEVAARYQMYHALALLGTAWALTRWPGAAATAAGWLFVAGTVLFSGSLYALVFTGIRSLGAITPLGGVCFLAGWAALGWAAWHR